MKKAQKRHLELIKSVVLTAIRRQGILGMDLCPHSGREPSREDLVRLSKVEKALKADLDALVRLEAQAKGAFGVPAITSDEIHDAVRVAVCVMIASGLHGSVQGYAKDVADLAELAAGQDVEGMLAVHEAFRIDGLLRRICEVDVRRSASIGSLRPEVREEAIRITLGLGPDREWWQSIEMMGVDGGN